MLARRLSVRRLEKEIEVIIYYYYDYVVVVVVEL
jgi:hypothetical protein